MLRIAKQCEVYENILYLRRVIQYRYIICRFRNAVSYGNGLHASFIAVEACKFNIFESFIVFVTLSDCRCCSVGIITGNNHTRRIKFLTGLIFDWIITA